LEGLAIFFTTINAVDEANRIDSVTGLIPAGGASSTALVKNWANKNKDITSLQIKNG